MPQNITALSNSDSITIYLGEGFYSQGFYIYKKGTTLQQVLALQQNSISPDPNSNLLRALSDGEVVSTNTLQGVSNKTPIQSATYESLKSVPGVGSMTAKKIIEYVIEFKPTSAKELINVEGVGDKTLKSIMEVFY